MELFKQIDLKLENIYSDFKNDKSDFTGWGLIRTLREESGQKDVLEYYLLQGISEIAWQNKEVIIAPNVLKNLLKSPYKEDKILVDVGHDKSDFQEVFKGIYLRRGIIIKILDFLDFQETKNFLVSFLTLENEEINPEIYVGQKFYDQYREDKRGLISKLLDIFEEEYSKMFGDDVEKTPRIMKIKNENRVI